MVRVVNMSEIMRGLIDQGDEKETKTPPRPQIEAQCMELRDRYNRLQQKHGLKPGMLVRMKPGINPLSKTADGDEWVWIIVRRIDLNDPYDRMVVEDRIEHSPVAVHGFGCDWLIATTPNDQSHLHLEIAASSVLEPIPSDKTGLQ